MTAVKTTVPPVLRVLSGLLALVLLAGCGGGEEKEKKKDASSPTASATPAETPYLDVPEGVTLTAGGTNLGLGQKAMVAWQPRQKEVAAVELSVVRIERTSFDASFGGWKIDDRTAAMTPYFVRFEVTNATDVNLGGNAVPLYLSDDAGTLVEASTFKGSFRLCSGGVLPKAFGKAADADLCLVYFVAQGRELTNLTFQLPGDLEPVTWAGEISKKVEPPKPEKKSKKGKAGKKGKADKKAEPDEKQQD